MPRKSSAANTAKRSAYNVRQAVGNKIKIRRLALGWSQQELADRFGVSRAAISQYEIGTGEVNAGDLPRLAEILGINLPDFYDFTQVIVKASSDAGTVDEDIDRVLAEGKVVFDEHGTARIVMPEETHQQNPNRRRRKRAGAGSENADETERNISIVDNGLRITHQVPYSAKPPAGMPLHDRASIFRLSELAGLFLSLSRQDQETVSRVAQSLKDKPTPNPSDDKDFSVSRADHSTIL